MKVDITQLTIGQVFGAFIITFAVISAIVFASIKIYNAFIKLHIAKSEQEKKDNAIECHGKQISEMDLRHKEDYSQLNSKIDSLTDSMKMQVSQQQKVNCAILRDRIIQSYKFYKNNGEKMSALDYENLDELFTEYFANNGNHLVSKIYKDFKTWDVILDLDDDEE